MQTLDYSAIFKRLYYHLYSNSSSSRAEKLLDDVTKLLLYSYAVSRKHGDSISSSGTKIYDFLQEHYRDSAFQASPFSLDDTTIANVLPELFTLDLGHAPAHVVGEAVQSMIGPRIRGDKGQFFTPESLVRCIIKIVGTFPDSIIIDPACGTGGFLSAARSFSSDLDKSPCFIGADKDRDMANLAFAVMEIEAPEYSKIHCCNSLEFFKESNPLHDFIGTADMVITNPPFGAKIGITDKSILSNYDFGHVWSLPRSSGRWHKTERVARKQDPQVLFIELCVNLLKEGGKLGIVLPEGIFYSRALGYIWQYLEDIGKIIALVDCPRNTFQPSTDTKTNVLIYEKTGGHMSGYDIWCAQALLCGHDRRGRIRTQAGVPIRDDFKSIGNAWPEREDKNSPWVKVIPNKGLYIPRYYINRSPKRKRGGESITLGELIDCDALTIRSGHEVGSDSYGSGDIPYVRTSDINNFEISSDPTNSVSEDVYEKFRQQENLRPGDILFIADGRYRIGKTAIITEHNSKCVVQSHIDILTLKEKAPLNPYELLYLLNSSDAQTQIGNLVFVSSTLGTIGSRIREISIPLPMRDEEWNSSIRKFKHLLNNRASMLAELKNYEATDGTG